MLALGFILYIVDILQIYYYFLIKKKRKEKKEK